MRRMFQTVIILASTLLLTSPAMSQDAKRYSGSGRKPPKSLSERHIKQIKELLPLIPSTFNPYEIVGLGMVESSLTPRAISHTGDYGLMQVNCRIHRKRLKTVFGFNDCEKDMLVVKNNMKASLLLIELFRKKYRQCRGSRVYSCYNGGQGWKVVQNRCLKKCSSEKQCRKCTRPARYADSVKRHIRFLKRKYSYLFKNHPSLGSKPAQ